MLESLICLSSDNTIFSHLGAGARFPDFYCVFYVTKLCVSTKAMFQWRVSFCEWRFTHDTIFMVDDSLLLHIFPRFFDKTSAFQPFKQVIFTKNRTKDFTVSFWILLTRSSLISTMFWCRHLIYIIAGRLAWESRCMPHSVYCVCKTHVNIGIF